ncbi:hypothetical protein N7527_002128 [Penicillium freii]|nr:hypothetical protein N7527_002128 [Penicillium freii]
MAYSVSLGVGANVASSALVFLLTPILTPFKFVLQQNIARKWATEKFYADEDGEASRVSIIAARKFSTILFIVVGAAIGSGTAFAHAALYDQFDVAACLHASTWVRTFVPGTLHKRLTRQNSKFFLLVQSLVLATKPSSPARYTLGIKLALSCLGTALPLGVDSYVDSYAEYNDGFEDRSRHYFVGLESTILIIVMLLSLSIPRRPDVFRDGAVVDRERTACVLSRLSLSWIVPLIRLCWHKSDLGVEDLPKIDSSTRASTLQDAFASTKYAQKSSQSTSSLPRALFGLNKEILFLQLCLSMLQCFLAFAPHASLFQILRLLERRSEESTTLQVGFFALTLGVSMMVSSWLETWIAYTSANKISIKMHAQVSAAVFDKAMRLDAVSQPGASQQDQGNECNESFNRQPKLSSSSHNAVNLVAVDIQRIRDWAAILHQVFLAPMKLCVACVFVERLLGWQCLVAGLMSMSLLIPLNTICVKNYATAESGLMTSRDRKMTALAEALKGIRQIKFSALEHRWEEQLNKLRDAELDAQQKSFLWDVLSFFLLLLGPVLLSIASLVVYVVIHHDLTASVTFTAISALGSLEAALALIPIMLSQTIGSWISIKRVDSFLRTPERVSATIPANQIRFENATIAWPVSAGVENESFSLQDLNASFPLQGLSIIHGRTGSGKSLMLASILGECEILKGKVMVPSPKDNERIYNPSTAAEEWNMESAIAFVAQNPWIEAATIRDNILFGNPLDAERYRKVLYACALPTDLNTFNGGDLAEIGPNGVNLSGGQKARISLARALYSRAGILIMDDIFSAVDVHTARHLFQHALTGELSNRRTIILATHHLKLCLPRLDYLVCLDGGLMKSAGTLAEMHRTGVIDELLQNDRDVNDTLPEPGDPVVSQSLRKMSLVGSTHSGWSPMEQNLDTTYQPRSHSEDELSGNGAKLGTFYEYFQICGGWICWTVLVGCYVVYTGLFLGRNWWLSLWSRDNTQYSAQDQDAHEMYFCLGIYVAISLLTCIVGSLRMYFGAMASLRASRSLFRQLLPAILRARLRWLDTVPIGRLLNLFSTDFAIIDGRLGLGLFATINYSVQCFGLILAGVAVDQSLAVCASALGIAFYWYVRQYLSTARQLKRLESISRSSIQDLFAASLTGLCTIRAYNKGEMCVGRMHKNLDAHTSACRNLALMNGWIEVRLKFLSCLFVTACAMIIASRRDISPSLAGFVIGFTIQISTFMVIWMRMFGNLELDMNSTERVLEYMKTETEEDSGKLPPAAWPTEGRLEICDLHVSYAPELPPVLRGLSFSVDCNQRVGIVGRTGAGKSSLALALFQMLEAQLGHIYIDGIDISQINLRDLRSRMAIIPQNPTLFAGTIRSNLDPFTEHDDSELLFGLQRVQWAVARHEPTVGALSTGSLENHAPVLTSAALDAPIAEGGSNLSQGQKQLLSLARAMISTPKILLMDEATSALDDATDKIIQQSIRSDFPGTTMLVIAHRMETIADFDRILVIDAGRAAEFGTPAELMQNDQGLYRAMVEENSRRGKPHQVSNPSE